MPDYVVIHMDRIDEGDSTRLMPIPVKVINALSAESAFAKSRGELKNPHFLAVQEKTSYELAHGILHAGAEATSNRDKIENPIRGRRIPPRFVKAFSTK